MNMTPDILITIKCNLSIPETKMGYTNRYITTEFNNNSKKESDLASKSLKCSFLIYLIVRSI